MVDSLFKGVPPLDQRALDQLQSAGQSVLPTEDETADFAERELALAANPPSPDQLLAHLEYLPHPQPWSRHNVSMFCQCLTSMSIEPAQADKIQVKVRTTHTARRAAVCGCCWPHGLCCAFLQVFLNRILGLPVCKQNALFELFVQTLNHAVLTAKAEGKYEEVGGHTDKRAQRDTAEPRATTHARVCVVLCRPSRT